MGVLIYCLGHHFRTFSALKHLPAHFDLICLDYLEFLTMYGEAGNALLDSIIMGNKTWVHYQMPKSKATSMQWKHKDEKEKTKTASTGKVTETVFWD